MKKILKRAKKKDFVQTLFNRVEMQPVFFLQNMVPQPLTVYGAIVEEIFARDT